MRCIYFRVRGYNRFDLGQVRELIIKPDSPIQLVLGTNGAGKSSLLALLLPTVPEKADFDTDGEYEYHCEHRGKIYKLISKINSGFKHAFYIDDSENLNVGGTSPIQWKLIEEHLETDDQLNRLMLGYETAFKFTEMPLQKRRDWLTRICPVNVEYALDLFTLVKKQVRSLKAVVEHTKGKLLESQTHLDNIVQITPPEVLEGRIAEERKALERMMGLPLFDSDTTSEMLLTLTQDAKQFTKDLITQITRYPGKSVDKERAIREDLQNALLKARAKLDTQADELMNLDSMLEQVKQAGVADISELKAKRDALKEQLAQDGVTPNEIPADIHPETTWMDFESLIPTLTDLLMNWVDPENTFTVTDAQATSEYVEKHRRQVSNARDKLAQLENHLDHLNGQPETQCPQCQHTFTVGVQPGLRKPDLVQRIENGKAWLAEAEPKLEEANAKLKRYLQWDADCRVLNDLIRRYPSCKSFWTVFTEEGRNKGYGKHLLGLLAGWQQRFERWDKHLARQSEISRLERTLERLGNVDMQPILDRRNVLLESREELLSTVTTLMDELAVTDAHLIEIIEINEKVLKAKRLEDDVSYASLEFVNYLYTRTLRNAMTETIRNINEVEQTLNAVKGDQRSVAELETMLKEAAEQYEYAQAIMDELSPSNGLIADALAGPINAFIDYMNGIIEQIWEYDLQVLPCAVDATGLNYRFPLLSAKSPTARKDIVQGSRGQKEIINQAFIIAMMHYKGFTDWPLLLDEFASNFDPQHQSNAMEFIRNLVDTSRVSQVWFISHYVLNHTSFNTAQACVLDKTNIVLPEIYNEHVQLL